MNDDDIDTLFDNALSSFFGNKSTEDDRKERNDTYHRYEEGKNIFSLERKNTDSGRESNVPGPTLATSKGLQFDPLGGRKKQVKWSNASGSCAYQREKQDGRQTGFAGQQEAEENDQLIALMQELLVKKETDVSTGDTNPMMDTLAALVKQQSSISQQKGQQEPGTSETPDQEDDFGVPTQFLDGIMKQLVSKDVLYQPMKDICEKYPSWLEKEKGTLDTEDYRKYHDQYTIISKMCRLYETDPENFGMIMHLLQEVCGTEQ